MYTYRNTRTGVQFVSVCECFGEDIEKVSPPETAPASDEGLDPSVSLTADSSPSEGEPKRKRKKK